MFQQFRSIMRQEFPHARFDGEVLSPGWLAESAAQALSLGFFGTIVSLFAGDYVLPPPVASALSTNKGTAFFAAMGMNMLAGRLIATSAFEVLVNGVPVFSKVRAPTPRTPATHPHAPSERWRTGRSRVHAGRATARPSRRPAVRCADRVWAAADRRGRHPRRAQDGGRHLLGGRSGGARRSGSACPHHDGPRRKREDRPHAARP